MTTVLLPFNPAAPPIPPPRSANPTHRILVLDDDDDIREIYVETLVHGGYQVDAAADGQAGWEALQVRKYDLLITDHEMPRVSGLELVKKVCSSGMTMPVIMASGLLSAEELERHTSIQIAAALPKPFSPGELLQTVQQVLRGNLAVGLPLKCVAGS
jgi:two-component system OmpR family response regulator